MTYKEFCEAVDEAVIAMVISGPYKNDAGDKEFLATQADKESLKDGVYRTIKSGLKVYAQNGWKKNSRTWISVQSQNTGNECELITP